MNFKRSKYSSSVCRAILGPTNTGKTYYALERMISYKSGVIGVPLRLLAREIYDRLVMLKGAENVVLNTGEEKIRGKYERYWVCTTEAMPVEQTFEFVAVDEIQLCADEERGHIFTERLLNSRGQFETLFLGSVVIQDLIKTIIPDVEIISRDRLSKLSYSGKKNISKLGPRSAVVDFSVDKVYEIAEQLRVAKGGAAVVLGALSPKTRNAQVELYQNGDVDHIVATDAIGMGLNLPINNVYFAAMQKFDGRKLRPLHTLEVAQIAGRAGRYTTDGFFGETGSLKQFGEILINEVEDNIFPVLRKIKWRNSELEFDSIGSLINSLDLMANQIYLERSQDGTDVSILKFIRLNNPQFLNGLKEDEVKLLWKVCQIPDFRKISNQDHANLIIKIFDFIRTKGFIPPDWLKMEINRLDSVQGDIDILSKRLSFIRTWSFVSNINNWLLDSKYFIGLARSVEDKLSDALHLKLTQRFVDLRRSVLIKKGMTENFDKNDFELGEDNCVYIKGHLFGKMNGFVFNLSGGETVEESKKLMQAVRPFLLQHLMELVKQFYEVPENEITLDINGQVIWRDRKVAYLEKGQDIFVPKIKLIKSDELDRASVEKIQRKLDIFITNKIESLMPNLLSLRNSHEFSGAAAGLVHIFLNNLGVVMKSEVIEQFKSIDNDSKSKLRNSGIRFGYKVIYDATLLKPEASKIRISLFNAFHTATETKVLNPPPGLVTIEYDKLISKRQYLVAGFFVAGARAIRIDMLERLYFLIREHLKDEWIAIQPTMLSITGLGLEDFAALIKSLRFEIKYEKVEKGDEVITLEKESYHYKVLFKKQSVGKSEKKMQNFGNVRKTGQHRKSSRAKKHEHKKIDSPFSSLKVLLEN